MATEDDEDDTDLPPAEMHAEPASTAEAAQHAAQAAAAVRQAELKERTRLEEDAIGGHTISQQVAQSMHWVSYPDAVCQPLLMRACLHEFCKQSDWPLYMHSQSLTANYSLPAVCSLTQCPSGTKSMSYSASSVSPVHVSCCFAWTT